MFLFFTETASLSSFSCGVVSLASSPQSHVNASQSGPVCRYLFIYFSVSPYMDSDHSVGQVVFFRGLYNVFLCTYLSQQCKENPHQTRTSSKRLSFKKCPSHHQMKPSWLDDILEDGKSLLISREYPNSSTTLSKEKSL